MARGAAEEAGSRLRPKEGSRRGSFKKAASEDQGQGRVIGSKG